MAGTTIPAVPPQFFDDNGAIAAGFSLWSYEAGTTTLLATYSDVDLTVANTNPIVLDSAGRATIFLQGASYKFVLKDTDGVTVWTRDNVIPPSTFDAALDVTSTAGEVIASGDVVYCSDGSGSLTAGRWYLADADNDYSSNAAAVVGIATSGAAAGGSFSVRLRGKITGLAGLSAGSTYYVSATAGDLTGTAPANSRAVAVADTTTSVVLVPAEGANDTTGPLPEINGHALTGIQKLEDVETATVGNVGLGEDVLGTFNITAGALTTDGDSVVLTAWGICANNANNKTIRVRLKDTDDDTVLITATPTVSEATHWWLEVNVMRTAAGTAQTSAVFIGGPANTAVTYSAGNNTTATTITWSDDVYLELTGETDAASDNDVQMYGGVMTISLQA